LFGVHRHQENNMPPLVASILWLSLLFVGYRQQASPVAPPQGVWLSDGYGWLIQFDPDTLHTYEVTAISCMAAGSARRPDNAGSEPPFVFRSGSAVATVFPTSDPDTLRLHSDGAASDIVLHRTSKMPERCQHASPNTPQQNYAVFWQAFAEQYPFFALHKVDWRAVDKKMRPTISADTKPTELFQIFRQMIEPLQDAHTGVYAPESKSDFDGWRNDPNHLEDDAWKKAATIVETKYVHGGLQTYCRGHIQFGKLANEIGYLRVTTFYGYGEADGYDSQLQCLDQSLDTIFGGQKLSGLITDVRLNKGGDDPLGIEIASRLTKRKYLGYFKVARNNSTLDSPVHFTERQACWVVPSTRPGFAGKVVLLIGPDTVSAGETFAMALMGREPHVTFIGVNTQGVFSDVLVRTLPNGWQIQLPNEVYLTTDGKAFDATGVPPDIRTPFFSSAELQSGRDAALEEAIKRLTN
jgi:hypothetical protein